MAASGSDFMSNEDYLGWDYLELDSDPEQTDGVEKCGHPNCKNCERINSKKFFTGLNNKRYEVPSQRMTCKDRNVVYLVTDPEGHKYTGKTTQSLNSRMSGHRSDIYNEKSGGTRLFETHFASNKQLFEKIEVQIIDYAEDPEELAARESYWIDELETYSHPKGLNSRR